MGVIDSVQSQFSSCFYETSIIPSRTNFSIIQEDQKYIQQEQWYRLRNTAYFDHNKLLFMYPQYSNDQKTMESYWQKIKFGSQNLTRDINDVILPKFKYVIRKGIPMSRIRSYLIDVFKLSQQSEFKKQQYNQGLNEAFKGKIPDQFAYVPLFGNQAENLSQAVRVYYLNSEGLKTISRVLWVIHKSKHIQYCPTIVHMASIMILFLEPWQLYAALMYMIEDSINLHLKNQDSLRWHFTLTQNQISRLSKSFFQTVSANSRTFQTILQHMYAYDIDQERLFKELTLDIFLKHLPFPFVYRIFCAYINQGVKIYFRVVYALLKIFKQPILKCQTLQKLLGIIYERSVSLSRTQINNILKIGFRLSLPGPYRNLSAYQDSGNSNPTNVYYFPSLTGESEFLNSQHFQVIWSFIPIIYKHDDPKIVFPSEKFGYSLSGLLLSLKQYQDKPVLLIIKDTIGSVFGSFFLQKLTNNIDASLSFTSDTFVFTLSPLSQCFKPTGYNTIYCRNEQSRIFFGSGKYKIMYSDRDQLFKFKKICREVILTKAKHSAIKNFMEDQIIILKLSIWSVLYLIDSNLFKTVTKKDSLQQQYSHMGENKILQIFRNMSYLVQFLRRTLIIVIKKQQFTNTNIKHFSLLHYALICSLKSFLSQFFESPFLLLYSRSLLIEPIPTFHLRHSFFHVPTLQIWPHKIHPYYEYEGKFFLFQQHQDGISYLHILYIQAIQLQFQYRLVLHAFFSEQNQQLLNFTEETPSMQNRLLHHVVQQSQQQRGSVISEDESVFEYPSTPYQL